MKKFIAILCLLSLSALEVYAQEADSSNATNRARIKCYFGSRKFQDNISCREAKQVDSLTVKPGKYNGAKISISRYTFVYAPGDYGADSIDHKVKYANSNSSLFTSEMKSIIGNCHSGDRLIFTNLYVNANNMELRIPDLIISIE